MKSIYFDSKTRIGVRKKRDFVGTEILVLKLQERRWWGWDTVEWLHIELQYYWGWNVGLKDHLRMAYQISGYREVWPPCKFDLQKRCNQMFSDYFKTKRDSLLLTKAYKKHISNL